MYYLKVENNKIVQAPKVIERNGMIVYGYNKPENEAMLFADGYAKYPKNASSYYIKNGVILPRPTPTPGPTKSTFTKLQIRRAMRNLNMEKTLDSILSSKIEFRNEWNDAVEIDLDDPMIQQAVDAHIITQEMVDAVKRELN